MTRARVTLLEGASYTAPDGRTFRKGIPVVVIGEKNLAYYQISSNFSVVEMAAPEKKKAVEPKPEPKAPETPEPEAVPETTPAPEADAPKAEKPKPKKAAAKKATKRSTSRG